MDEYDVTYKTWNKIAKLYQDQFMDLTMYNDSYDVFLSRLKKEDASILEIGCGPGNITKYLKHKRPGLLIDATDVAPNMIELASQNVPDVNFSVMDCREVASMNKKYDGIMCGFCLPYISKTDVQNLFSDAHALLNENAVIYVSALEGDYEKSGFEKGSTGDASFVYYYSLQNLTRLFKESGFYEIESHAIPFINKAGEEQQHLILIARR